MHEMAKYVSDAPANAPGLDIPSIRWQRDYLVCEFKAKPANSPLMSTLEVAMP
jgi:hypothetical protein